MKRETLSQKGGDDDEETVDAITDPRIGFCCN